MVSTFWEHGKYGKQKTRKKRQRSIHTNQRIWCLEHTERKRNRMGKETNIITKFGRQECKEEDLQRNPGKPGKSVF
jgi:hypothetical protein